MDFLTWEPLSTSLDSAIELFVITFENNERKMENSCLVGIQGDSSFYGNQRDTLILLLVCVELDNTPLLCKLRYLWGLESIPCILRLTACTCLQSVNQSNFNVHCKMQPV